MDAENEYENHFNFVLIKNEPEYQDENVSPTIQVDNSNGANILMESNIHYKSELDLDWTENDNNIFDTDDAVYDEKPSLVELQNINILDPESDLTCSNSTFVSNDKNSMLKSRKRCRSTLQSDNCEKDEVSKNDKKKLKIDQNECLTCGKQFSRKSDLARHNKTVNCKKIQQLRLLKEQNASKVAKSSVAQSNDNAMLLRLKKMVKHYCPKCSEESEIDRPSTIQFCCVCESQLLFKCLKCNKQIQGYKAIKNHIKSICDPQEIYQCAKCSYTSFTKKRLTAHQRSMHNPTYYECEKCSRICKSRPNYNLHIKRYCGLKFSFHCDHCHFYSEKKKVLRKHILKEHIKAERFACDNCDASYKCKYSLDYHLTICGKKPQHKCSECYFVTKYGFELMRHVRRTHSGKGEKKSLQNVRARNILNVDRVKSKLSSGSDP